MKDMPPEMIDAFCWLCAGTVVVWLFLMRDVYELTDAVTMIYGK